MAITALFGKNIVPFSYVELFGYDKAPNEGTVTFLAKFGAISPATRK